MTEVILQSYGASRTVTGSRHMIQIGARRVLLDCGLFQGSRREANERNRHLPVRPDAVILSHAHIDHSGAIPALVRGGYRGPIFATPPTEELSSAMLRDVARIQASDARHLNKRRRKGQPRVRPLYQEEDVRRTLKQFVGVPYDKTFEVFPGVTASFQDAGHIIGSAGVRLVIEGGPSIYFTGDVGRRLYPILRDPVPAPDVDVLISECTYGTRDHPPADGAEDDLRRALLRAVKKRGKVLIPAFSVGRTQNLLYAIARMWQADVLPRFPVFVDSPLAEKATRVYRSHRECYDAETVQFMAEGGRPFTPPGVHYVENRDESKALNDRDGPFAVIAGSGMCEGGRIVHHLMHNLHDPSTTVLIVGWCAPHTLGRRLLEGDSPVRVMGQWRDVRAKVARINAYSAHAGRSDLVRFLDPGKDMEADVFLVHGEEETCLSFAKVLEARGHRPVTVPETYALYPLIARSARKTATVGART